MYQNTEQLIKKLLGHPAHQMYGKMWGMPGAVLIIQRQENFSGFNVKDVAFKCNILSRRCSEATNYARAFVHTARARYYEENRVYDKRDYHIRQALINLAWDDYFKRRTLKSPVDLARESRYRN